MFLVCGIVNVRLQMVEDAVPGKQLNELEEKRQELIGETSCTLCLSSLFRKTVQSEIAESSVLLNCSSGSGNSLIETNKSLLQQI